MNTKELRAQHPTFRYQSFETETAGKHLEVLFHFQIAPDIEFTPHISIPILEQINQETVANFAFHLGLIEAISYWKSTCSPEIIVEAGKLTDQQVGWWHDLFIHGLGEFYYQNNIDFSSPNFVNISSTEDAPQHTSTSDKQTNGDLILVGGGKDSVVTLELLSALNRRSNVLFLNPTVAIKETAYLGGYTNPIVVQRKIDERLIQLNDQGYLNGHTPFSAYLSFLGVFVGFLHGYEHVIASNESSAGEGNILFHRIEVNHQYSKSFRYEQLFDNYRKSFLTSDVKYFSFLRPLYELQIASLFAETETYDQAFCSCNVGRNQYWCGKCPKCAFVYLSLSPVIDEDRKTAIFGQEDYFEKPDIQKHIIDLVGLGEHKPFDCVGTEDESRLAVALTIHRYKRQGLKIPAFLEQLSSKLSLRDSRSASVLIEKIKTDWSSDHFLPKEYEQVLREKMSKLEL